jgi:hypothetical protein
MGPGERLGSRPDRISGSLTAAMMPLPPTSASYITTKALEEANDPPGTSRARCLNRPLSRRAQRHHDKRCFFASVQIEGHAENTCHLAVRSIDPRTPANWAAGCTKPAAEFCGRWFCCSKRKLEPACQFPRIGRGSGSPVLVRAFRQSPRNAVQNRQRFFDKATCYRRVTTTIGGAIARRRDSDQSI